MDQSQTFLADMVRVPTLHVRGVAPGASIDEAIALEGTPAELKEPHSSGSLGCARYAFELGEVEELTVWYAFGADRLIESIELFLVSFPHYYWKQTDGSGEAFFLAHEAGELAPLTPAWTATRDALIEHFTHVAGAPPEIGKVTGASQKRQAGKKWVWTTPTTRVALMSYVDDNGQGEEDVRSTLKLTITAP